MGLEQLSNYKVLHYCMGAPYLDNGGYTETVMAKCQKMFCKDVVLLTTNKELLKNGEVKCCSKGEYVDDSGVRVIRLDIYNKPGPRTTCAFDGLLLYKEVYKVLASERPDVIIVDGVGGLNNFPIAKYIERDNKECIVVCHSHATAENVDRHNKPFKRKVWNLVIRMQNVYMRKYYRRIYGIIPGAVDYMVKHFGIPAEKSGLLCLGYDGTLVDFERQSEIRKTVRNKYGISQDDFLVVHGGKLGEGKKTKELTQSLKKMPGDVAAIIFGDFGTHNYGEQVDNEYEIEVKSLAKSDTNHKIVFSGSLNQRGIYDLFMAADLAVFPGAPSCMRQEAVGNGVPIIMSLNPGDEGININLNDNAIYLNDGWNIEELHKAIFEIYSNREEYSRRSMDLAKGEYLKYSYYNQAIQIIEDNR